MKPSEKKVMTALAEGEFNRIKATEEFIETLVDEARETVDINNRAIEDEEAKGADARENYIAKLEEQNKFLQKVIDNGEAYLENAMKMDEFFYVED